MEKINIIYSERFLNKNLKNFYRPRYKKLVKIKPTDDYFENLNIGKTSNSILLNYNLDNINYEGCENFTDSIWKIDKNNILINFMFFI